MVTPSNLSVRITENRRKREVKLAKKYAVTEAILAEFFQVPIRVIEKDVKALNLKLNEELPAFSFEKQKRLAYIKVSDLEHEGMSREDALAECGFWSESSVFLNDKNESLFSGLEQNQVLRMQRSISLSEYGYSVTDIKQMTPGLSKTEIELIKADAAKRGVVFGKETGPVETFAKERHEKGDSPSEIKDAVGYAVVKLVKTNYDQYKKKYYGYLDTYNKKHGITTEKALDKNKKKQDCFNKWQNEGYTQDELAKMYNVTRITIGNWIREMKAAHLDEAEPIVVRRRNIGSVKQDFRNMEKEYYLSLFVPGLKKGESIYKIATENDLNWQKALKYLREDGLVPTMFENKSRGLQAVDSMDKSQKAIGYHVENKNNYFGYGPNAGISTVYDRNKYTTLNHQRKETSYEIQNKEPAKQHFVENDGDMVEYWLEKHISKENKTKEPDFELEKE